MYVGHKFTVGALNGTGNVKTTHERNTGESNLEPNIEVAIMVRKNNAKEVSISYSWIEAKEAGFVSL